MKTCVNAITRRIRETGPDMLVSCETSSGRDRLIAGRPTALRTRTLRLATVPASAGRLFGYERESARLRAVIGRGKPATVGIRAAGGAGKTEFLARALRPQERGWPDGKVFVSARHLAAEDIVALVSDAVFAIPDPRARPSADACSAALAKRRLLVGLDDVRSRKLAKHTGGPRGGPPVRFLGFVALRPAA